MANVRLFYGSTIGNTQRVAELIKDQMGDIVSSITDIAHARPGDLASADALILGTSTWDAGQLQEDWETFFPFMDQIDLGGKKVAMFGLGDANGYSDQFVNALGMLYNKVKERGAEVVGFWPTDDYDFQDSDAVEDGRFVGLVIDEDNQPEKTESRVKDWVRMIQPKLTEEVLS